MLGVVLLLSVLAVVPEGAGEGGATFLLANSTFARLASIFCSWTLRCIDCGCDLGVGVEVGAGVVAGAGFDSGVAVVFAVVVVFVEGFGCGFVNPFALLI